MLPSGRRLHGIASGQLLLCTTSPSKPDGFATSPSRGAGAERLRGCTKTKPFPNEPPSVHTIPEGVLVILIIFVKTGQIGIRQHS